MIRHVPGSMARLLAPIVERDLINSSGINARAILRSEAIACKRFDALQVFVLTSRRPTLWLTGWTV